MTSSSAPLAARVRVADTELDVLFLITQYLRELQLSTTVVALLRESGVDPVWLCGPSRELALLREWVFQGEWTRVRALLEPLKDVLGEQGLAAALARVDTQALLEEFHLRWTLPRRRREILDQLQSAGTHSGARLTKQQLQHCLHMLQGDTWSCHHDVAWSLDEARLCCFESLVPLFRDAIDDDDDEAKYLRMPRRQLVALLHDALLFHKQRSSGRGSVDLVGATPLSSDTLVAPTDSGYASLRLVEPVDGSDDGVARDALSQSVDWSRSPDSLPARASVLTKHDRSRNPLVMSMAFTTSARREAAPSQETIGSTLDSADVKRPHTHQLDENTGQNEVEQPVLVQDAVTQTDMVLSVDRAVEAGKSPTKNLSKTIDDAHSHLPEASEIVAHNGLQSSNQTIDTVDDHDDVSSPSAALGRSSKTGTVSSNAPLEAWCTSRRGEHQEEPHAPQDSNSFRKDESTVADKHGATTEEEPHMDADHTMRYDDDDEDAAINDDDDAILPLRSYAQLTIDSVVRAHVVAEVREAQAIRAMDIAPDGSEMVIGTNARALRVFDLTEPLASSSLSNSNGLSSFLPLLPVSLERHKHHASSIYTACYNHISPAHAAPLIATGAAESSIKVLARWTQQEMWIRGHTGKSRALCFASPSLLCSAASGDMVIRAWDVEASSSSLASTPCVQRFDGHVGEIQAIAITTASGSETASGPLDRGSFVSSSMDRTVRLWDPRSAQCARVLARTASPAFALAFQPQHHNSATTVLATGHQDGSIALWDLRTSSSKTAKPLATIHHHQDECRAVSWSPDGQWLLSASFDGTLCLHDVNGHELHAVSSFHQHEDKILQAQWHPSQPAIVTTGADKLVKLWGFT